MPRLEAPLRRKNRCQPLSLRYCREAYKPTCPARVGRPEGAARPKDLAALLFSFVAATLTSTARPLLSLHIKKSRPRPRSASGAAVSMLAVVSGSNSYITPTVASRDRRSAASPPRPAYACYVQLLPESRC